MFSKKEDGGKVVFLSKFLSSAIFSVALFLFLSTGVAMAADNVVTDIMLFDSNQNGQIDQIVVSVDNDSATTTVIHDTSGWTVTDGGNDITITAVDFGGGSASSDPLTIYIHLDESDGDLTYNTGNDTMEVSYVQQGVDAGTEFSGAEDTQLVAIASGDTGVTDTENDGASPVIIGRHTNDFNGNGRVDEITLEFSEAMENPLDDTGVTVVVTGYTVNSYHDTVAGDNEIEAWLTELGTSDGDATPNVQLTVVGNLEDANGNAAIVEGGLSAATDEVSPVVIDRFTSDEDGNGQIDAIFLQFSEDIAADNTGLTVTVAGYVVDSYDDDVAGDDEIMVILTESGAADTGATPSVQLTVAGNLVDLNGVSVATEGGGSAPIDEALPVVMNRYTEDDDHNGQIDTIFVEFSENMLNPLDTTNVAVTVTGYVVTTIEDDLAGDNEMMITITESGSADTDATPTIQMTNAGNLEDPNGNAPLSEAGLTSSIDESAPVTIDRFTSDEDGNGQIDTIFIQFSESMENPLDTTGVTVTVVGYVVSSYEDDIAGDDEMMITLVESGSNDTDATPDVELTVVGNLEDANANPADSDTGPNTPFDEAAPTVALSYSENPVDAGAMQITAVYSEAIVEIPNISINQQGTADIVADAMTDSGDQITWTYDHTISAHDGITHVDGLVTVSLSETSDSENTSDDPTNTTFTIDTIAPVISATDPATDDSILTEEVSYAFDEAVDSGEIVFTRTGGSVDGNSPHTCTLQGTALNTGAHTDLALATDANACISWANSLVDGAIYTVTFDASDAIGNLATTITNTGVTFDTSVPSASTVTMASDGNDSTMADVGDVVTLTIVTDEDVENLVATIDGNVAAIVAGVDDQHWTATYTTQTGDTEGLLAFTLDFDDLAGNSAVQVTAVSGGSAVTFDETPPTVTITLDDYSLTSGETTTVTFTFSEEPVNFGDDDRSVEGGTLSAGYTNVTATIKTTTFTPTVDIDDATNLITIGTDWEDFAGNSPASATSSANYTVDTRGPSVIGRSTYDVNRNGKIDQIIMQFSENLGADISGITVTVDGFVVGSYTDSTPGDDELEIIFSENGGVDTSLTPDVQLTVVGNLEDVNGNSAIVEASATTASDGAAPVISEFVYVDNDGDGMIDRVNAIFSEDVVAASTVTDNSLYFFNPAADVGDFTDAAFGTGLIDLITGTISQLSFDLETEASVVDTLDDGDTFSVTIRGGNRLEDTSGNFNINANIKSNTITYTDGASPIVELSYSGNPANEGDVTIQAAYSEPIVGTPNIDIDQQGTTDISADAMTDSGDQITWTYVYTVVADNGGTYEDGVVTVDLSSIDDASGNTANSPSGTTFTTDTTAPTVTITSNPTSPSDDNSSLIVDFSFSEVVTGFNDTDITFNFAGGGAQAVAVGPVMQYNATSYNLTLAGADLVELQALIDSETLVVLVDMTGVEDSAGTSGAGDAEYVWTFDTTVPTVVLTYSDSDKVFERGQVVTITATFNEPMADSPVVKLALDNSELTATDMTKVSTTVYTYSYTVQSSSDISTVTASLSVGEDEAGNAITTAPTSGATFEISTPVSTSSGSSGGGSATTYCASVEYDAWQDVCINNIQYRNILVQFPTSCTLTSTQRAGLEQSCDFSDDTPVSEVLEDDEYIEEFIAEEFEEVAVEKEQVRAVGLDPEVIAKFIEAERKLVTEIDEPLVNRLVGKILLQVEQKGEAWYVNPLDKRRHFLGRPLDAFNMMRGVGLGISEDSFEAFNGYAPDRLAGRILLRVEANGEAYYVNPDDNKMHYLGRPADAFNAMRNLGLGISNDDIRKLGIK